MADAMPDDFDGIKRKFAALWESLCENDNGPRSAADRRLLVDQVRYALDRGEERLSGKQPFIIANSFVVEGNIHQGAATELLRVRHRDLGTLHAIKTLKPDHAADPVAGLLLLREAEIGLRLRHPDILATQALLRLTDGRPAIIFEWCGHSLSDRLLQGPLSLTEIRGVMRHVLSALAAIHDAGFVHCDLSPANLLLDGDQPETIRLGDFGIAIENGRRHAALDLAFAGQRDFAPPEQRDGKPLDGRADLYAAGRLLFLLLEHCEAVDNVGSDAATLRKIAAALSETALEARPENAKTALAMLGGFRD